MAVESSCTKANGVITGIPRSGTSYLCSLLHELDGHVAINEPLEVFSHLQIASPSGGIAGYYVNLRKKILSGLPVENKTINGSVITDTAKLNVRTAAPILVARPDFMLWTKNTLAYLGRLEQLLTAMPGAIFVACVRHPADTIGSWTRTFSHLRDADVEKFPFGGPSDSEISRDKKRQLARIACCENMHVRRALLWRYLAGLILRQRDRVVILRLEDLIRDQPAQLTRIMNARNGQANQSSGALFSPISSEVHLPDEALGPIAAECAESLTALGYVLR